MDDFMKRVDTVEEDTEHKNRRLAYALSEKISKYVEETEVYYTELYTALVKEGWPELVVVESINHYKLLDERNAEYARNMLNTTGCDFGMIELQLATSNKRMTTTEFKEKMLAHIEKLKKEDVLKEEAKLYANERAQKQAQEESSNLDYTTTIDNYVMENKRTRCVSARELADKLVSLLPIETCATVYFGMPLYATFKNLGTPIFDEAFTLCLQSYQKSLVIQQVINNYLTKVSPSRDRDEYEIDKLISLLPSDRQVLDDRSYKAYTAICWLQDTEIARKTLEELSAEDIISDEPLRQEFTAQMHTDVNHGEPYEVAYRNAFDKAIGKVSKQYGKIKAFPTHIADVASQSLSLGEKETLGQNLYSKVQQNKEIERIVLEKNRERDELKEQLDLERARQDKLLKTTAQQPQPQQAQYQSTYPYRQTLYGQVSPQQNNSIPAKYIGIGVNAALLIVCLLFEKLIGTSTLLLWVGLAISTYGWVISPTRKDYGAGSYYANNQNKFVTTSEHHTQAKWVWYILGGYTLFIVCFLFMAAF